MRWQYTYHRFNSEQEFNTAILKLNLNSDQYCLDVIGILYNDPVLEQNGNQLISPISGFHVNAAWLGEVEIPIEFLNAQIVVTNPKRVWA